jgi:hypothetical protein
MLHRMAQASQQRLARDAATTLAATDLGATDLALLRGIADRSDLATVARAAGLTRTAAERSAVASTDGAADAAGAAPRTARAPRPPAVEVVRERPVECRAQRPGL